jgi:uncharacterized protein YndB with AHSA1/START domain/GNAT superfamily N-acetyltransferase
MASIRARLTARFKNKDVTESPAGEPAPVGEEAAPQSLSLPVSVLESTMLTWESQVGQYPLTGPPGISYFRGEVSDTLFVNCLLYRDETGELVGILNHYPTDMPPYQHEGSQNVWVHPDRRRQGIGSDLITEASLRWPSEFMRGESTPELPSAYLRGESVQDAGNQSLTATGAHMLEKLIEKRSVARVLPFPLDVVFDAWWDADGMREWMCPRPATPTHIEIDPQVGGNYRIDIDDEGLARSVTGRYFAIEPSRGFACTWRCTTWEPTAPESIFAVQLEPRDGGSTLMTIRHLQLQAEVREGYLAGWVRVAAQLEEHLAGH